MIFFRLKVDKQNDSPDKEKNDKAVSDRWVYKI